MDNLNFGLAMLAVGMGGTLLTLGLLVLMIDGLRALFPPSDDPGPGGGGRKGDREA